MTNRTPKVASAILVAALAGAFLSIKTTPVHAADKCLLAPKGVTAKGSHWYYRVDHVAKRNCWYVRTGGGQPASTNSSNNKVASPQAPAPLQPSVSNARAEVTQADIAQSSADVAKQLRPSVWENPLDRNLAPPDNSQSSAASPPLDLTNVNLVETATPQAEDSGASLNSPTPSVAPVPLSTAGRKSAPDNVSTLLLVMIGALAGAAALGSVIFKLGGATRNYRRNSRRDRRPIWDSVDVGANMNSPPMATRMPMPRMVPTREQSAPGNPDEIVRLLARLSKEAAA